MRSKRAHEGYAMTDHRWSPGISAELHRALRIDGPPVPGGQMLECALRTCCGCSADLLVTGRDNSANWCFRCDEYMCDSCSLKIKLGEPHKPYMQFIAEYYDQVMRNSQKEPR